MFGGFDKSVGGPFWSGVSGFAVVKEEKVEICFDGTTFQKPIGNASHTCFRAMLDIKEIEVFSVI